MSVEWPLFPDRFGLMFEASGRHQVAPTLNGTPLINGQVDEVILGVGTELLFTADVQVWVGYQRTLWGRNVGGFDTMIVTLLLNARSHLVPQSGYSSRSSGVLPT